MVAYFLMICLLVEVNYVPAKAEETESESEREGIHIWDGTADTNWKGEGTLENPYLISSAEQLAGIASISENEEKKTFYGKYFKQTCDIYLNDIKDYFNWKKNKSALKEWKSIPYFYGDYDGDGHTIYGLYTNSSENGGVFGYCKGAYISNLNISSALIEYTGSGSAGGIIDTACIQKSSYYPDYSPSSRAASLIDNCTFTGEISANSSSAIGGIIGTAMSGTNVGTITISNCVNYGTIKNGSMVGGIVGSCTLDFHNIDICACKNAGVLKASSSSSRIGGIVGSVKADDHAVFALEKCVNTMNVYEGEYCGGIIGYLYPVFSSVCNISESYNIAKISSQYSTAKVGGIVGLSYASVSGNTNIKDCFNTGEVSGEKYSGGIVGAYSHTGSYGEGMKRINNAYNVGNITGTNTGAIIGSYNSSTTFNNTYYLKDCCSKPGNIGKALSSTEMINLDSFDGFSREIWSQTMSLNDGYPVLSKFYDGLSVNCTLTDEMIENLLVEEVKKYTTGPKPEAVTEILNSDISSEAKQRLVVAELENYGITDMKEGIKYLNASASQRWAFQSLTTNDLFCSYQYEYWLNNTPDGKLARLTLGANALVFNNEISAYINPVTYASGELPGVKKYKEMLMGFICVNSNRLEAYKYAVNTHKTLSNLMSLYKVGEDKGREVFFKKLFDETDPAKQEKMAKDFTHLLLNENNNGKTTVKLKSESISKALGIAGTVIKVADSSVEDIMNFVNLSTKMDLLESYSDFLYDLVYMSSGDVPDELRVAAFLLYNELQEKYLGAVKKSVNDFIDTGLGVIDFSEMVLGEAVSDLLSTVKLGSWMINTFGIDMAQVTKNATFTEGYAYLGKYYTKKLQKAEETFNNNPCFDTAWDFCEKYDLLWSIRKEGEKSFENIYEYKGLLSGILKDHDYKLRKEVVDSTLSDLDSKWKFNEDIMTKASQVYYKKKMQVNCPVDVEIYKGDERIALLKDGEESEVINEYGRFIVFYNAASNDYSKIAYFNEDEDYDVKIVAKDSGLVSCSVSQNDENFAVYSFNNEILQKEEQIQFELSNNLEDKLLYKIISQEEEETITKECEKVADNEYVEVSSLELGKEEIRIKPGEKEVIDTKIEPYNASYPMLRFDSSNPEVASVANGVIEANGAGECVIDVVSSNDIIAHCKVTVTKNIGDANVIVEEQGYMYDGNEICPKVVVFNDGTLEENVDYTVSYSDNINPGKGKIEIKGIGLYDGVKVEEFVIGEVAKETEPPVETGEPIVTKEPEETQDPAIIDKPATTKQPASTQKPHETGTPMATSKPEVTKVPAVTLKPEVTKVPAVTLKPEVTKVPAVTLKPEVTKNPAVTLKPEVTKNPAVISKPEVTKNPKETKSPPVSMPTPIVTKEPEETQDPAIIDKPATTKQPASTQKPHETGTPMVTSKPEVTKVPAVTLKPEVTKVPAVTLKPEVTKNPAVTLMPEVTKNPAVISKPEVTKNPKETKSPPVSMPTTNPEFVPESQLTHTLSPSSKPTESVTVQATYLPDGMESSASSVVQPENMLSKKHSKLAKIKIIYAKNNKKRIITIKVKQVKNAEKYKIQYGLNKKFKKVKVVSARKLTIVLKNLKKKTYYIRICGVNGKKLGPWSKIKKIKVKRG